jgi:IS30 family transposase
MTIIYGHGKHQWVNTTVFPKGKDFSTITQSEIIDVQNNLNYRPRKSLGFKTPVEVFYGTILELQGFT